MLSEKNKKVLELYSGLMVALKASDVNPELEARPSVKQDYLNVCLFCAIFLDDISKVNEAIIRGADLNCCYNKYQHIFLHWGITDDLSVSD